MSVTYRKVTRGRTPIMAGVAGPTKSGKTKSAFRMAVGLAGGGPIAMINTEGPKGHQYADEYEYYGTDIGPPFRPEKYQDAFEAALALKPKPVVVIVDSMTHLHDGPGGLLEWHESELDRLAGDDYRKRKRNTWTAWIAPKAAENKLVYAMQGADVHVIFCFRAKKKLLIVSGKDPVDLGWQPIASERVAFETLFTLVLPPHSKGVPDLSPGASELREPFDRLIKPGQITEQTGQVLAKWSAGGKGGKVAPPSELEAEIGGIGDELLACCAQFGQEKRAQVAAAMGAKSAGLAPEAYLEWLRRQLAACQEAAAASGSQDIEFHGAPPPTPTTTEE